MAKTANVPVAEKKPVAKKPTKPVAAQEEEVDEEAETKPKRVRVADLSDEEKQERIEELLGELEESNDPDEKRKIRTKLRALGHQGGLNKPKAVKAEDDEDSDDEAPAKPTKKPAAKPAAPAAKPAKKPAKPAPVEDEDEDEEIEDDDE